MKYAITFKDDSIEEPNFKFESKEAAAKAWFDRHADNTSSLDMIIVDQDGDIYTAIAHKDYREGPVYGYDLNGPY